MTKTNANMEIKINQTDKFKLSLLTQFKETIFSDETSKTQLINAINRFGYEISDFDEACNVLFFKLPDRELQYTLGPFLRNLAINTLKTSQSTLCQNLRFEYENVVSKLPRNPLEGIYSSLEQFYKGQLTNYRFVTNMETLALPEVLGLNLIVTSTDDYHIRTEDGTRTYLESQHNKATVHLYNQPGYHYFVDEGNGLSTIGDGNCFYYGIAQHLRHFILLEAIQQNNIENDELLTMLAPQEHRVFPLAHLNKEMIEQLQGEPPAVSQTEQPEISSTPSLDSSEKTKPLTGKPPAVSQTEQPETSSAPSLDSSEETKPLTGKPPAVSHTEQPEMPSAPLLDSDEYDYLSLALRYIEPCMPLLLAIAVGVTVSLLTAASAGLALVPALAIGAGTALAMGGFFAHRQAKADTNDNEEVLNQVSKP